MTQTFDDLGQLVLRNEDLAEEAVDRALDGRRDFELDFLLRSQADCELVGIDDTIRQSPGKVRVALEVFLRAFSESAGQAGKLGVFFLLDLDQAIIDEDQRVPSNRLLKAEIEDTEKDRSGFVSTLTIQA